jgi:hypothetical protein
LVVQRLVLVVGESGGEGQAREAFMRPASRSRLSGQRAAGAKKRPAGVRGGAGRGAQADSVTSSQRRRPAGAWSAASAASARMLRNACKRRHCWRAPRAAARRAGDRPDREKWMMSVGALSAAPPAAPCPRRESATRGDCSRASRASHAAHRARIAAARSRLVASRASPAKSSLDSRPSMTGKCSSALVSRSLASPPVLPPLLSPREASLSHQPQRAKAGSRLARGRRARERSTRSRICDMTLARLVPPPAACAQRRLSCRSHAATAGSRPRAPTPMADAPPQRQAGT